MLDFKILSKKGRVYKINFEDREIASLAYEKWSNRDAEITMNDGLVYQVSADKLLSNIIEIKQKDTLIAKAVPNFKGDVVLTLFRSGEAEEFLFSRVPNQQNDYVVRDQDGNNLIFIHQEFQWKTLSFFGSISLEHEQVDLVILPITLYCANIFRSSYMGNTAAMVNVNHG